MAGHDRRVLAARGLVKQFGAVRALDGVDVDLYRGEIHGLVGQNGAGKSTLIRILTGAVQPDEGRIELHGRAVAFPSPGHALAAGIAVVHQELSLVRSLDAAENLFLDRPYPRRGPLGLVDWPRLYEAAGDVLRRLHPGIPLRVPVGRLSPAFQTLIAIGRALGADASVLILDEPTASLTDDEVQQLFAVLRRLRDEGTSIVYVSHRLPEIVALCDRITVLRDGRVVASRPAADLDGPEMVRLMTGRHVDQRFPPRRTVPEGEPLLDVRGLWGRRVRGASFTLRRGEVLGVAGLMGSGRSELLRLLCGAARPAAGHMHLEGRPIAPRSPGEGLRLGIAMVPEERRAQALIPSLSVRENMALAHLDALAAGRWWLRAAPERRETASMVERLHIRLHSLSQPITQLSGGNQQKVVFARYLLRPPRVLLLDEPTRGVDVGTKFELYQIVRRLADEGTGVMVASSELPELLGLSDRIIVLHDGELVADVPADGMTEESLSTLMFGRRPA